MNGEEKRYLCLYSWFFTPTYVPWRIDFMNNSCNSRNSMIEKFVGKCFWMSPRDGKRPFHISMVCKMTTQHIAIEWHFNVLTILTHLSVNTFGSCQRTWTLLCYTQWTMLSTRLFSHDNNVVTALFNHQYCYNLLTTLSNNDNNREQACSINIDFSCSNWQPWTTTCIVVSLMLNNIVETIVNSIVRSTTLFGHDNRVVTALFNQQCCSCNNFALLFLAVHVHAFPTV